MGGITSTSPTQFKYNICTCRAIKIDGIGLGVEWFKYNICTCRASFGAVKQFADVKFKYNICTCRARGIARSTLFVERV